MALNLFDEAVPNAVDFITSTVDLVGAAPAGATLGLNTLTGQQFYVDNAGNWRPTASGGASAADYLAGIGRPADTLGIDGNFYRQLDTAIGAFRVWGPKAAGAWPAQADREITPDPGNAQTYVFSRTDTSTALPTAVETSATLHDGDIANCLLSDQRRVWWRHNGTIWVQTRIDAAALDTGSFIGAATTFAALPATAANGKVAIAGDWVLLTQNDIGTGTAAAPQFQRGGYVRNATAYVFSWPLDSTEAVTGDYIGSAATFAALPTSNAQQTATNGDWAVMSAPDVGTGTVTSPQYPAGGYLYNGTSYSFAFGLGAAVGQLTTTQATLRTDTTFGAVSGQRLAEAIEAEVRGVFMGFAATYATLPTSNAGRASALAGDWAFLTANITGTGTSSAPQYPMGIYRHNGTAYALTWAAHQEGIYVVADGATLTEGRIHGASPATSVVVTVTPPAVIRTVAEMGWFSVVNNGAGTVTVTGLGDVQANTSAMWTANAAGTAWVLSSAAPTTTTVNHLALTATARLSMVNIYPSGSNLASHIPPAVVAGRDYAIATANGTTGYDNVQAYVANAAGTAWLAKVGTATAAMTGATATVAGTSGLVPVPAIGQVAAVLRGDGTWGAPASMTGATATVAGTAGIVPAPAAGDEADFLRGDGTWGVPAAMAGATATVAGTAGLVPAPAAGDEREFLRGDGTWAVPAAMTGATATAAGTSGIVPAPAAGSESNFLRGDGTWADLGITGRFIGSAATFAALPTTDAANGDWAALSADDVGTGTTTAPQYRRGIYLYNGTAYSFAVALDVTVAMAGDYMGTAATFAALPTTATYKATIASGDWAVLSSDDVGTGTAAAPQYARGIYRYNGTAYVFSVALGANSTGDFIGTAATFAALPTTAGHKAACVAGDWSVLTADEVGTGTVAAPQYARGVYRYNGTAYAFSFALGTASTGDYIGTAATFAALPKTATHKATAVAGDWALLTADIVGTGTASAPQYPRGIYAYDGTNFALAMAVGPAAMPYLFLPAASVTAAIAGHPTVAEFNTWLALPANAGVRNQFVYYTGTATSTDTATNIWFVDRAGLAKHIKVPSPALQFLSSADLTPALTGSPTLAEFRTWLTGHATVRDQIVWYNGTIAQTTEPTHVWYVDRSGNATVLRSINPFRAITGSATGTGQDGVAVPVQITLAAGKGLNTVTATNGATVTNINAVAGTCLVTCNGDNTELSHTTRDNATFTSLQQVGSFTPATPTTYDGGATITTAIDFNKCDLIEWQFRLTTDLRAISSFVPVVIGGATPTMEAAHGSGQISSFILNAADATLGKLTNVDCHGVAFEVISIRGWANAANGYVVATGREVRQAITLSANGGALNVNGATSATLFAGTSARVSVDVPVGQMVSIATTATPGVTVGIADARTGALEVAIAAGTTGTAAITVGFFTPGAPRIMTSVNAGIDVALGTLRFRMASGGNRSLQVSSNTGANVNLTAHAIHHNGGQSAGVITMTATTTAAYVMGWNFGAAGEWMRAVISDTTNGRTYDVTLTVGSGYNNNALVGYEIL